MSVIISILTVLILLGCNNTRPNPESQGAAERVPEPDRNLRIAYEKSAASVAPATAHRTCSAVDITNLMNRDLHADFFSQLDSVRKVQYPNNDQETEVFVDLTPHLLGRFLKDINKDSLIRNRRFDKEYHFKIAPPGFTDPAKCKDRIEVVFNEEHCSFRIVIYNTFLVDDEGWCGESSVVYVFGIQDGRVIDFWRNEAG